MIRVRDKPCRLHFSNFITSSSCGYRFAICGCAKTVPFSVDGETFEVVGLLADVAKLGTLVTFSPLVVMTLT